MLGASLTQWSGEGRDGEREGKGRREIAFCCGSVESRAIPCCRAGRAAKGAKQQRGAPELPHRGGLRGLGTWLETPPQFQKSFSSCKHLAGAAFLQLLISCTSSSHCTYLNSPDRGLRSAEGLFHDFLYPHLSNSAFRCCWRSICWEAAGKGSVTALSVLGTWGPFPAHRGVHGMFPPRQTKPPSPTPLHLNTAPTTAPLAPAGEN